MEFNREHIDSIIKQFNSGGEKVLMKKILSQQEIDSVKIIYVPAFNLYFHTSSLMLVDWLFPLTAFFICLNLYEYRKKIMNTKPDIIAQ